jgi:DNA-binding transcriptional ArsR family regulator
MQDIFHPDIKDIELPNVFSALSDPIRLRIVAQLGSDGEHTCAELQPDGITKSTVSHHFKVLRESGIIRTRLEGTRRFVSLRKRDLDARFPGLLVTILALWGSSATANFD